MEHSRQFDKAYSRHIPETMPGLGKARLRAVLLASALPGIVALGLAVRTPLLLRYGFSPDEAYQLNIARGADLSEVLERLKWEAHPPLTYFLRHYLLMLGSGVTLQRVFSLVPGLLSIVVAYRIGQKVGNRPLALAMAALTALGPENIVLSQVSRVYAFATLFLLVAFWCALAWFKTMHRTLPLIGFAVASSAALMSFYGAALAILAMDVAMLHAAAVSPRRRDALSVLAVAGAVQVAAEVWCYWVHARFAGPNTAFHWWRDYIGGLAGGGVVATLGRTPELLECLCGAKLGLLWCALLVVGLRSIARSCRPAATAIVIALGAGLLASIANTFPWGATRQSVVFQPFVALAVSAGILELFRILAGIVGNRWAALTGAVLLSWSTAPMIAPLIDAESHTPYSAGEVCVTRQGFSKILESLTSIQPDELIVTDSPSASLIHFYRPNASERWESGLTIIHSSAYYLFRSDDWGRDPTIPCMLARSFPNLGRRERVWFLHVGWEEIAMHSLVVNATVLGAAPVRIAAGNSLLFALSAHDLATVCPTTRGATPSRTH